MDFYGRKEEQKAINYLLNQNNFQSGILYGRRRLGKTELLKHCFENAKKSYIIYQCNQESEKSNIDDLLLLIQDKLNIRNIHFDSFVDCIEYLFDYAVNHEFLFAIDEYPYIRKLVDGLDSKIQRLIDKYQSKTSIKFFLLGSSISIMEAIQSEKNPLYRRFNLSILLKEMDYYDSQLFYPNFSNEDKVRLYAAFGGVPFYNKQINQNLSVKENIILLLSGQFSHLLDEITVNIKEELTKIGNAYSVFSAIADGAFHYSDILAKTHINTSSSLYDTLEILTKMDLVENISPINDKNNKKKSGYVLTDNATFFYYHFIYHRLSSQKILSDEAFYDMFINDDFENNVVPKVFEQITKQYLIRQNKKGTISPLLLDIGTYWYDNPIEKKNGQFDVVANTEKGYIIYEVKFTNSPVDNRIIKEEIDQISKTNLNVYKYGFVSKSGFKTTNKNNDYVFIELDEMFK